MPADIFTLDMNESVCSFSELLELNSNPLIKMISYLFTKYGPFRGQVLSFDQNDTICIVLSMGFWNQRGRYLQRVETVTWSSNPSMTNSSLGDTEYLYGDTAEQDETCCSNMFSLLIKKPKNLLKKSIRITGQSLG